MAYSAAARNDEPGAPCVGCRTPLPPHAMFCVECGLCALDITGSGTVIAPPPERPALIGRQTLQSVDRLLEELEAAEEPDEDIEDDLVYIDKFIANLEAAGGGFPPPEQNPPNPWPND